MKCPKCNNPIFSSDNYCVCCGNEIDPATKQAVQKSEENYKKRKYIIAIIIEILIFAIFSVRAIYIKKNTIPRNHCSNAICSEEDCADGVCNCTYIDAAGEAQSVKCQETKFD